MDQNYGVIAPLKGDTKRRADTPLLIPANSQGDQAQIVSWAFSL
jgi:hypothetical protein